MASDAQIVANRLNARKSTGPRTVEGKAVVAQNAVRHGLLGRQAVIRGEDPGEFEFYREQMLGELAPAGAVESMLAERAVGLAWRLRRAERIQAEVFDAMLDDETTDPVRKLARSMRQRGAQDDEDGCESRDLTLGRVAVRDFGHARVLDRLGMYERRIEHSLYKTMNELQKLRLLGELDPVADERRPQPSRPAAQERSCETKPITRELTELELLCGATPEMLTSATGPTGESRACETKPISRIAEPQTQVESQDEAHWAGDPTRPDNLIRREGALQAS